MSAEIPCDSRLGSVLDGAYRITRVIGEGGMGAVYEAVQLRLNKRVAVKLMSHQLTTNQTALARFRREAAITSRLGHPNLVSVIDFGTSRDGEPYMVMEYLDGEDLDQRLQRCTTVPVDLAAHIIRQAASALGAAHAQGIVHRDLKPANIFLVDIPGEIVFVKVLDFGISKVKAAGSNLTKPAVAMGTPFYMSPEQAMGKTDEIDHPSDQWALACIAWEMLCGHTPFAGDDVTALFYQVLNSQPESLLPRVPGLAPEAESVLLRALSKSVRDRYPTIRDFASAFGEAVAGRACGLPPPKSATPSKSLLEVLDLSAEDAPEAEESPPRQEVVLSRATEEIVDKVLKKRWFRIDPKLASVLFVLTSALVLSGTLLPHWPRRSPPAKSSASTAVVLAVDAGSPSISRPLDLVPPPPVLVPSRKKFFPEGITIRAKSPARKVKSIQSPPGTPRPSPEAPTTSPAESRRTIIREL